MLNHFFKDLKIIELASVLAGPSVGAFFSELGADVLKVENKLTGGDITRTWKGPSESSDQMYSAYWASVNLGKRIVLLDLRENDAQQKVHEWIRAADIVISNYKPASAKKMKMDYDFLRNINPRLIYAEITAFGETDQNRPAFDVVLQAEAGFLYMTGESDRPPVKMPVALIDILAGHQLKEAILIALLQREKSGRGSYVTVSLIDAAIASLANQANNWLMGGFIPERMGTKHPNIAPYGEIFRCADNEDIVLAIGTEDQFVKLCTILECPELSGDKRFASNGARVIHRAELQQLLTPFTKKHKRADLLISLHAERVPVGSIKNMKEVFNKEMMNRMIIAKELPDGTPGKRVRTVAFEMKE